MLAALLLYGATQLSPRPFFAYERRGRFLVLRSDAPIPDLALPYLQQAEARLQRSALFQGPRQRDIVLYLCQHPWRWAYFGGWRNPGSAFTTPMGWIFTRPTRWPDAHIIGASGRPSARTVDYQWAHEGAHALTRDAVGAIGFLRLPTWVLEGYADDVALDPGDAGTRASYTGYRSRVAALLADHHVPIQTLLHNPPR